MINCVLADLHSENNLIERLQKVTWLPVEKRF